MNQQIIDKFNTLPENNNPSFTKQLSDFVLNRENNIESLEKELLLILNEHNDKNIKFCAYYALMIIYRRYENQFQSIRLTEKYESLFSDIPLFVYQKSRNYLFEDNILNFDKALENAQKAIDLIDKNEYAGFFHNFSEIVAIACENDENFINNFEEKNDIIDKAFKCITKAIQINPTYAKYYSTLGRLQSSQLDFTNAEKNFMKAIQLENKTNIDYPIRIAKYQDLIIKNKLFEVQNKIDNEYSNLEDKYIKVNTEIHNSKANIIEFLSFFSAMITLILTSVQLSLSLNFTDAASLILVLCGVLIISFGTISCMIKFSKKNILKAILFLIIGFVLIIIGLVFHIYFNNM